MGLKVTVQIDTTVPSGGRIRVVNQSVTGPAGAPGTNGTNGVGVPTGGTTGQALVKASNTNYDTTWTTIQSGIPATLLDAKGDLIVASAADTAARLAVGATNGQILTVASATSTGLSWQFPNQASNTFGTYVVTTGTSRVYVAPGIPTVTAATVSGATAARWWIYRTERPLQVKNIWTWCTTGQTGATMRLGLYNVNANMEPTTLLADYGTIDAASTGRKGASGTSTVLGAFAVAMWCSNHTSVRFFRANSVSASGDLFGDGSFLDSPGAVCWGGSGFDYSAGLPANAPTAWTDIAPQSIANSLFVPGVTLG
jgi:hypothetical protein